MLKEKLVRTENSDFFFLTGKFTEPIILIDHNCSFVCFSDNGTGRWTSISLFTYGVVTCEFVAVADPGLASGRRGGSLVKYIQ